ncbi:hypothetical protein Pla175_05470 [Pirellulimonas nuda]|uniref:Phage tail tape measure protein n=1 Tax=Pirellulimonas nuda TaxID=2528009 RepID=A0A518D6T6_9BACT|nr:hypothetical protein [Pirellulimonas nuda]QDU87190.1 hypothetical protein Pla175_05470 [Pirellulimonas nuda]
MASAGALRAGKAVIEMSLLTGPVDKGLRTLQKKLRTIGSGFQTMGRVATAAGAAITAPLVAAISKASDAEETLSKFGVVFGDQAPAIRRWGDELALALGRSKYEIAGAAAGFQDLLKPMGVMPNEAADLSKKLTELSIDLASFNNMTDADVQRDLTAALTGSGEVMKKYGVIVSEAAVKQELLNTNIDPKFATEAQRAFARFAIILAGTTDAQGDALRTAGSFANQMKGLKTQISDYATEIGMNFLPAATAMIGKIRDVVKGLAKWSTENPGVVKTVGYLGAALAVAGPAAITFGAALPGIAAGLTAISAASAFLIANPLIAAFAGVAVVVAALLVDLRKLNAELGKISANTDWRNEKKRSAELNAAIGGPAEEFEKRKASIAADLDEEERILRKGLAEQKAILDKQLYQTNNLDGRLRGIGGEATRAISGNIASTEARLAKIAAFRGQLSAAQQTAAPVEQKIEGAGTWLTEKIGDAMVKGGNYLGAQLATGAELLGTTVADAHAVVADKVQAIADAVEGAQSAGAFGTSNQAAIFDTRFAGQQFGSTGDAQLRELREIKKGVRNLDKPNPLVGV